MFHTCFTKIYNQSHISAFFSKAASSERRVPEYSMYLKGGSHDGVSNAQELNFPTLGYSPPKCSCNGKHTYSSEFMIPT